MHTTHAYMVIGLGFGDEGKGATVEALVRAQRAGWVIRFNGGPQAAHHLVQVDGRAHCCAQLGAGVMTPGVRTLLSRHMLVEPLALAREAEVLRAAAGVPDALERLWIDARCVVVTPYHRSLNRLQELARGAGRHGSCGLGVGQAALDARNAGMPTLTVAQVMDPARLRRQLNLLRLVKLDQAEQLDLSALTEAAREEALAPLRDRGLVETIAQRFETILRDGATRVVEAEALREALAEDARPVVCEGAQGVLLDEVFGLWPHVTASTTTFANAQEVLDELAPERARVRVGVTRAYHTRHGAGPMPGERADAAAHDALPELHNAQNPWQGAWRVGPLDLVLLRYALDACGGVDHLAWTHVDRLDRPITHEVVDAYTLERAVAPWADEAHVTRLRPQPNASHEARARLTEALWRAQVQTARLDEVARAQTPARRAHALMEAVAARLPEGLLGASWSWRGGPTSDDARGHLVSTKRQSTHE